MLSFMRPKCRNEFDGIFFLMKITMSGDYEK